MKKFVFVLAIYDKDDGEMRFKHTMVDAVDEESAYLEGQREAKRQGWLPVNSNETANDYVVPILSHDFRNEGGDLRCD